jgi:hypothetical protein
VINDARRRQRRRRSALTVIAILVAALLVAILRGWRPDQAALVAQGSGRDRAPAAQLRSPPFRAWRDAICSGGHLVFLDSPPSLSLLRLYPIQRDVAGIRVSYESGKPVGVCLS